MQVTDMRLLQQWVENRDVEAFHELMRRHAAMIYTTARRVLGDAVEAEDVAQECFEVLLKAERRPNIHLPAWLHRVAVNRSINRLRNRARPAPTEAATVATPPDLLERAELYQMIDEALEELPDPLREALVAHFLEGATHDAIARELNVDRSTVTKRIQRGLAELRIVLSRRGLIFSLSSATALFEAERAVAAPAALWAKLGRLALMGGASVNVTAAPVTVLLLAKYAMAILLFIACGAWALGQLDRGQSEPGNTSLESLPALLQATESSSLDLKEKQLTLGEVLARSTIESGQVAQKEAVPVALPPPNAALPSISGRVTDAGTGDPAVGVVVVLRSVRPNGARGRVIKESSTDATGKFSFSVQEPAKYEVELSRIANDAGDGNGPPGQEQGIFTTYRSVNRIHVELKENASVSDIELRLESGAAILGRVISAAGEPLPGATVTGHALRMRAANRTVADENGNFLLRLPPDSVLLLAETDHAVTELGDPITVTQAGLEDITLVAELAKSSTVAGTVVDSSGNPVPGLLVFMKPKIDWEIPDLGAFGEFETAGNGTFKISKVPQGTYDISIGVPIGMGTMVGSPIAEVVVEENTSIDDLRLVHSQGELFRQPPLSRLPSKPRPFAGVVVSESNSISGRVVDSAGKKAPAFITVTTTESGEFENLTTDGEGRFVFHNLKQNKFYLSAKELQRPGAGETEPLEVARGAKDVVLVVSEPEPWSVAGEVLDSATLSPVSVFDVHVINGPSHDNVERMRRQSPERHKSEEGLFTSRQVHWPEISILVTAPGYQPAYHDVAARTYRGEVLQFPLEKGGTLRGGVVDAEGNPVKGAMIYFGSIPGGIAFSSRPAAITASDGTFEVTDFHPNTQYIAAEKRDAGAGRAKSEEGMQIVLEPWARLVVKVLCGGEPCVGARIAIRGTSETAADYLLTTDIDQDGNAVFESVLPGKLRLETQLEGATRFLRDIQLAPGSEESLLIKLPTLLGQVSAQITYHGGPVEDASVELCVNSSAGYTFYHSPAGNKGYFLFENVPPGEAFLRVALREQGKLQGYAFRTFRIPEGESLTQHIDLNGTAQVTGDVQGISPGGKVLVSLLLGQPEVSEASFSEIHASDNTYRCHTDLLRDDNTYTFEGLESGTYTVLVEEYPAMNSTQRNGYETQVVDLVEGESVSLAFTLK